MTRFARLVLAVSFVFVAAASTAHAAVRTPAAYGAKGGALPANATAEQMRKLPDDSAALQRMFDAMQPYDVARFPKTKAYRVSKSIRLSTSDTTLEFNGATILNDPSGADNSPLWVRSLTDDAHPTRFDGLIDKGWWAVPFARDTWCWFAFGTDPYDPNEEHYGVLVGPTEKRVWIPRKINGTNHVMTKVTKLCERVTVKDVAFDTVPGNVTDQNFWLYMVRNCTVDGIRGVTTGACKVVNSENVNIRNVDVTMSYTHGSAGSPVGGWQSRYVNVDGLRWRGHRPGNVGGDGVFLESWCQFWTFDHVEVTRDVPGQGWGTNVPVFFANGGSSDLIVRHVTITDDPTTQVYLFDVGGQPDQSKPRFDAVEVLQGRMEQLDYYVEHGWYDVRQLVRPPAN